MTLESSEFDPAAIPFGDLLLDTRLLSGIRDLGWDATRPVQSGVIPFAIAGHDVIACAETGTGKTAAFLVPILQRFLTGTVAHEPHRPGTKALVLAPTRELAAQILEEFNALAVHSPLSGADPVRLDGCR